MLTFIGIFMWFDAWFICIVWCWSSWEQGYLSNILYRMKVNMHFSDEHFIIRNIFNTAWNLLELILFDQFCDCSVYALANCSYTLKRNWVTPCNWQDQLSPETLLCGWLTKVRHAANLCCVVLVPRQSCRPSICDRGYSCVLYSSS